MSQAQPITPFPQAPKPTDDPQDFDNLAFPFVDSLQQFVTQMNSAIAWMNDNINAREPIAVDAQVSTLLADYSGGYLRATYSGDKTISIENEEDIPQLAGAVFFIANKASGNLTITAADGVTVNNNVSLAQNAAAIIQRVSLNVYDFIPIGGEFLTDLSDLEGAVSDLEANRSLISLSNVSEIADANLFESTEVVLSPPVGFPWTPEFSIWRDRSGKFCCSVDPKRFIPPAPTTVLYVDPVNGNDANTGLSWSQAFKKLTAAFASSAYTGTSGGCIVYISAGYFGSTDSPGSGVMTRHTALIGVGGEVRITGGIRSDTRTWTQQSSPNDSVYRDTSSGSTIVWDSSSLDDNGYFLKYTSVGSIAECQALPGSYYRDLPNLHIYIHTLDSTEPDEKIYVGRNSSSTTGHTASSPIYCENISFELGQEFLITNGSSASTVVFNKCSFKYMTGNGLSVYGRGALIYLFKCIAARNGRDGFNYEHTANTQRILEVDCLSELNGWDTSVGSNNGSTGHDQSVIIRINGCYDRNGHRNIHDIVNVKSWHLGCYSGRPLIGETGDPWTSFNFGAGIQSANTTELWLDSCTTQGAEVDLYAGPGSAIYTRRMSAKTSGGSGTIGTY